MQPSIKHSYDSLAGWVRKNHAHATHRLRLLQRARELEQSHQIEQDARLAGDASTAGPRARGRLDQMDERLELAEKIERWRYQHLHERDGQLGPEDRRLVDLLDQTARSLAGHPTRPPRRTADAVHESERFAALDQAERWLDHATSPDELIALATQQTAEHFSNRHSVAGETRLPSPDASPAESRPSTADPVDTQARRMLLYAPLYLSSYCVNHCVYCGFRYQESIERRHLSFAEAEQQADILQDQGFRHILLVAGDFPALVTTDYLCEIISSLASRGLEVAVEIAPQSTAGYTALAEAGACGVTLYQETYDRRLYQLYHPRGTKADYDWRLEGLERAAGGGFETLGLGFLLGLADPREELRRMIRHARDLAERWPDRRLAFSLPRIHDGPPDFHPPYPVDDETLVRLFCALRMAFPRAELVLSTRERPELRERLAGICITQMSAGSCTAPGGYRDGGRCTSQNASPHAAGTSLSATESPDMEAPEAEPGDWPRDHGMVACDDSPAGEQFAISDHRSAAEVAQSLCEAGLVVTWSRSTAP